MTTNGLRMILAEDDLLLRAGLASLLERSGFQVVGQAGDTSALLALVDTHDPELVVAESWSPPVTATTPWPPSATASARCWPRRPRAALATQVKIHQGHVRTQLPGPPERLGTVGRHTNDGDALAFQDDGDADHDQHEFDEFWA